MSWTNAVTNLFRGVGNLLETGSWKVEEAASAARTAETLLDRVDEEVEQRAQETLDHVNAALTYFGGLEGKQKMLSGQVASWGNKAKTAADKAKTCSEGSADRTKWVDLARQALEQKAKYAAQLAVVDQAVEAARPDAARALEMVEQIGLTREQALSQRDALQVANATASGKLALAEASKSWGEGNGPAQLLAEAERKVQEQLARAAAGEKIAAAMPRSADAVSATIARAEAESTVDAELAQLMK